MASAVLVRSLCLLGILFFTALILTRENKVILN